MSGATTLAPTGSSTPSSLPSTPSSVRAEPSPRAFLAFDYGQRRVGVASGNVVLGQARALSTLSTEGEARFEAIGRLIREWQPDALVVGVPFHPDGAEHDNTRRARRFARQLHGRFGLPVHEVDERYTTVDAASSGKGGGRAGLDAQAAALILDQYLASLSARPPETAA